MFGFGTLSNIAGGVSTTFDPAAAKWKPSAFWRSSNYSVSSGIGTWASTTAGPAVVSVTTPLLAKAPAATTTNQPVFANNGTTHSSFLDTATTLTNICGVNDNYGVAVIDMNSITSGNSGAIYERQSAFADEDGNIGLHFYKSGSNYWVLHYQWDAAFGPRYAETQLPSPSGRVVVQWKKSGGFLWIKLGSAAWVQGTAFTGATSDLGVRFRVGASANLAFTSNPDDAFVLDGTILALGFYKDVVQTDAWADSFVAYGNSLSSTPTSLSLTSYFRAYSGLPWFEGVTAGTSATVSGSGTGQLLTNGADPTVGLAVNGYAPATFTAASSQNLVVDTGKRASSVFTAASGTIFALVNFKSQAAADANKYLDAAIFSDLGTNFALTINSSGAHGYANNTFHVTSPPVSTFGYHAIMLRWNSTTLGITVDGTIEATIPYSATGADLSWALIVGKDPTGAHYLDGSILELGTAAYTFSDTDWTNYINYVKNRYGLTLDSSVNGMNSTGNFRAPYTGSPWVHTASSGIWGGTDFGSASPPSVGTAVNGYTPATFNGTTQSLAVSGAPSFISQTDFTFVVYFKATTASAPVGWQSDPYLIGDDNSIIAMTYTSSGVQANLFSNATADYQTTPIACATGGWNMAVMRVTGTTLKCRVNMTDAANVTIVPANVPSIASSGLILATRGAGFFAGSMLEVQTFKRAITDTECDNMFAEFQTRYPNSAAAYRATVSNSTAASGSTINSGAFTPVSGDLWVTCVTFAGNTDLAPTCTDNNTDGLGTYTLIGVVPFNGSADLVAAFVRNSRFTNTTSTTVTFNTGSGTFSAAQVSVLAYSGMLRAGGRAIRSSGLLANGAGGVAPTASLGGASLSVDATVAIVGYHGNSGVQGVPTGWTRRYSTGNGVAGLEIDTLDSGFTSTTVTWTNSPSPTWGSLVFELDGSADTFSVNGMDSTGNFRASYTGDPWNNMVSTGLWGGTRIHFSNVTPTIGIPINGYTPATFNGTSMGLTLNNSGSPGFVNTPNFTVVIYFKVTSLSAPGANWYAEPSIFEDDTQNYGITLTTAGIRASIFNTISTDFQTTAIPVSIGPWHMAVMRVDGTNLNFRLDNTDATAVPYTITNTAAVSSTLLFGSNRLKPEWFSGSILEAQTFLRAISNTECANIYTEFKSKYRV